MNKKNQSLLFGEVADVFDKYRPEYPEEIGHLLSKHCVSGGDLAVDVGSGSGLSFRYLQNRFKRIIGFEPDHQMVEKLKAKFGSDATISIVNGYLGDTNIEAKSVDVINCLCVFHWLDFEFFFKYSEEILKKNGIIFLGNMGIYPVFNEQIQPFIEREFNEKWKACCHPRLDYVMDPSKIVEKFKRDDRFMPINFERLDNFQIRKVSSALGFIRSLSYVNAYIQKAEKEYWMDFEQKFTNLCQGETIKINFPVETMVFSKYKGTKQS